MPGISPTTFGADSADLSLTVEAEAEGLRLRLVGDLDIFSAKPFLLALADALGPIVVRRVCVDLEDVSFLDAAGIRALLDGRRLAADRGAMLTITGPRPIVRRVLRVTGVLDVLSAARSDWCGDV